MRQLIHRLATRRNAALVAYLGLGLIVAGLSLPVMSVSRFGEAVPYSVPGTILALAGEGHRLLAALIFLFSVVLPTLKLAATLGLALSLDGLTATRRWRIVSAFNRFGKYSMLDVFVIAVLIVVIKTQGIVSASIEYGLYFFLAGIFASLLSSGMLLMALPKNEAAMAESGTPPMEAPGPMNTPAAEATRRRAPLAGYIAVLAGALLLLLAGLLLALLAPPGTVDSVLVQKRPGVDLRIVSLPDAPDYVLEIKLEDGWQHRTETQVDTPIGNGIVFPLPAIEIAEIREIVLLDDNSLDVSNLKLTVIPDEIVDRVRVQGERELLGEKMRFELAGPVALQLRLAYLVISVSAAVMLIAGAVLIVRLGRPGRV